MAVECDLEDLTRYCEDKVVSNRRIEEEEDVDDMPVPKAADRDEDDTNADVKEVDKSTVLESTKRKEASDQVTMI